MSRGYQEILRQAKSSRIKHVYNALIEIRKTFIKTDKGVEILVAGGLVDRLLELLKTWETLEEKFQSKVVDICTSILGNMCMLEVTRKQVIKLNGISIIAQLLLTSDCESIQNRCCRCLANIALSPGSWKLLHSAFVIERIVKLLNESDSGECKQTYIRTIRLLGQTSKHVQDLLDKKCVSILANQLDKEKENVSQAVLRCLHSLSTHCCSIEFAAQIISSGKVEYLLSASKEKNLEAFQLIVRLCNLPVFRPEFGNTGGITIFLELFNSDEEFYENLRRDMIDVLSMCCKEAVNRLKLRESGSLQKLVEVLLEAEYQMLHSRVISALVCFLYDQYSFDILLENGLVHVLIKQLNKYMEQQRNSCENDEQDVRHLQANKDCGNVTNCINVEEESQALKDGDDGVLQESIQEPFIKVHAAGHNNMKSEGTMLRTKKDTTPRVADTDHAPVQSDTDTEITVCNKEGNAEEKVEPESPKERQRPLYSIDSPTYKPAVTWDEDEYSSGAKCIGRFTPPLDLDKSLPTKTYSPLSNSSYYSPSEGSPDYVYSSSSPNDKTVQSGENSPQWPSSSNQDVNKVTKRIIYTGITTGINFYHSPDTSPERCKSGLSSPVSTSDTEDFLSVSDKDGEKTAQGIDPETDQTTPSEESSDITLVSATCKIVEGACHDKSSQSNKSVFATEKTQPPHYSTEGKKKLERDKVESTTSKKRKKLQCKSVVFENNVLILLSRTSQMTNPSKYLVTMETVTTLIEYIQHMEAPLARAARLLSRVFRNPLCFESLLNLNISTVIFQSLLIEENTRSLLSHVMKNRCDISNRRHSTSKLDTSSDEASDSDRFSVTCDSPVDDVIHPAKRQRTQSGEIKYVHHFKGTFHRQEEAVCNSGRCGIVFLEDLSEVLDSSYGRGVVEKLLCKESGSPKPDLCLALMFISWSSHSREYLCKQLNVLDQILTVLQDQHQRQSSTASTAITALSFVLQAMDCGSKYRKKAVCDKNKVACSWLIEHFDKRKSGFETNSQGKSGHATTLGTELKCDSKNCILDNEVCLDVEFMIGEVKIGANRSVLTKSSDIFAAMLEGHYSEARQSAITIGNTSVIAFKYIIHYLHGCTVENCDEIASIYKQKVSRNSTIEFIKIITEVDKYLLLSLKDELLDLLYSRYVIPESALPVLEFSVLHCYEHLQKSAVFVVMVDSDSVKSLINFVNEILDSPFRTVFLQLLEDIVAE